MPVLDAGKTDDLGRLSPSRCVGVDKTFRLALNNEFSRASRLAFKIKPFPVAVLVREPDPNDMTELSGAREKIVDLVAAGLFLPGSTTLLRKVILLLSFSSRF